MEQTTNNSTELLDELEAFGRHYRYDTTYMREMLEAAPEAYRTFHGFLPMASFRLQADPEVYFTATITAFRTVDCGPCLQLAIRKARENGVSEERVRAILSPEIPLPAPLESVRDFAHAILSGTPDAGRLRAELVEKFGGAVVVELALGIASAQVFPLIKRAMGRYQSCSVTPLEI